MDIFIPATPFERQLPSSPAVQEQPVASPPPVTPPKKRPPLLLFIVIILVLTLPVGVYLFQQQQQEAEAPFQGVAYPGLGVAGAGGANQSLGGALPTNLGGGVVHVGTDGVPVASVFQNSKGGYTVFKGSSPQPSTKTLADITTPDSGKSAGMITNLDKFTSGVEAAIIFDAGNSKLAIVDNSIGVDKTNYTGKSTKTVDLTILSSKTTLVPADLTRKVNVTYDKDTNPNTCATGCTGNSPLSSTQMSLGDALSEIARGNLTGTFQLDFVDSPGSWLSFQIKGGGSSGGGTNTGGSDTPPTKIPTPSSAHTSTPTPTTTMTPTPTHTPTPTPTTTLTGTPTHTPTGTISPTITPTTVIGNTGTPAPTLSYTPKTPVSGNESIWGVAAAIGGALLLLVGFAL